MHCRVSSRNACRPARDVLSPRLFLVHQRLPKPLHPILVPSAALCLRQERSAGWLIHSQPLLWSFSAGTWTVTRSLARPQPCPWAQAFPHGSSIGHSTAIGVSLCRPPCIYQVYPSLQRLILISRETVAPLTLKTTLLDLGWLRHSP